VDSLSYYAWSTNRPVSECLQLVVDGTFFFDDPQHVNQETQKTIAQAVLQGWNEQRKAYPPVRDSKDVPKNEWGQITYTDAELNILAESGLAELKVFSTFCEAVKLPVPVSAQ
jgi:hypothetical protein